MMAESENVLDANASYSSEAFGRSRSRISFSEADVCVVCESSLGKRKLNPKHHCRMCGSTVCAKCSQSQIRVDGEKSFQRACDPCASNARKTVDLRERLDILATNLNAIGGSRTRFEDNPGSLEGDVHRCEMTLPALQEERDNHEAAKTQLIALKSKHEKARALAEEMDAELLQTRKSRDELEASLESVQRTSELQAANLALSQELQHQTSSDLADVRARLDATEAEAREAGDAADELREAQHGLEVVLGEERQRQLDVLHQLEEAEARMAQGRATLESTIAHAQNAEMEATNLQQVRESLEESLEHEQEKRQRAERHIIDTEACALQRQNAEIELEAALAAALRDHNHSETRLVQVETSAEEKEASQTLMAVWNDEFRSKFEVAETKAQDACERVAEKNAQLEHAQWEEQVAEELKTKLEDAQQLHAVLRSRCDRLEADSAILPDLQSRLATAESALARQMGSSEGAGPNSDVRLDHRADLPKPPRAQDADPNHGASTGAPVDAACTSAGAQPYGAVNPSGTCAERCKCVTM